MKAPNVSLTAGGTLALAALVVVGLAVLVLPGMLRKAAGAAADAAGQAAQAVNPMNHDNVFAAGVNAVGGAIAGESDFSLGGWIYDITHPDEFKAPNTGGASGSW